MTLPEIIERLERVEAIRGDWKDKPSDVLWLVRQSLSRLKLDLEIANRRETEKTNSR